MTESPVTTDRWIKCISKQGNVRGVAIQATELVRFMAQLHRVDGLYARSLGEAAMAAMMVGSYCKPGERINLNIRATGLVRQALVDAYPDGTVRGYVVKHESTGEAVTDDEADPSIGPWGEGLLSVLRAKGTANEQPYIGTVPLVTGHLAKDMTFYWAQSEQIPSAVGLAVNLKEGSGEVAAAGGFLVQILPGASSAEVAAIEQHVHELHSMAQELAGNVDPVHLLSKIFQDSTFMLVEEKPLRFHCNCSWERVTRALTLVGSGELQSMLTEDNRAEVTCDFCTTRYAIEADALQKLIDEAKKRGG